ncbi:hypothetical protein F5884DRAFT_757826 [Xylogone sp. PMI_703]|nr:hypothetical protein F5884DRAFT_757826 [Xylogone sp. PMI_703]
MHEFLHQPSKLNPSSKPVGVPIEVLPIAHDVDWLTSKRPKKRRRLQWFVDETDSADEQSNPPKRRKHLPETLPTRPDRPLDAISRQIEAWREGKIDQPISDHESESDIDWSEPDMEPENVSGRSYPSWARHNMRIAARIEITRDRWGFLTEEDLNEQEHSTFKELRKWLDEWRGKCVMHHFLSCNGTSSNGHMMEGCNIKLSKDLCDLSSKIQIWLSRLVAGQSLSCPWCLVLRILCNHWAKGPGNRWAESGEACQYQRIILQTIVVMVECNNRFRDMADSWLDFYRVSLRNLDDVCQWLGGRTVGTTSMP